MVAQYPHKMQVSQVAETHFDVNTGTYWPAPGPTVTTLLCRVEPAGKGILLKTSDGADLLFNYIVYAPISDFVANEGDSVTLFDQQGNTLYIGIIARFNRGFFNMRIWV